MKIKIIILILLISIILSQVIASIPQAIQPIVSHGVYQSNLNNPPPTLQVPVFSRPAEPSGSALISKNSDNTSFTRGIMEVSSEILQKKEVARSLLPRLSSIQSTPLPQASRSLLSALPYIGNNRDQGYCGNCYVWAGTGALEIEHYYDKAIKDRLSVQYYNSNWKGGAETGNACKGGWPSEVAEFYSSNLKKVIPWSNANAGYADYNWASGPTKMPASSISTSPNYALTSVSDVLLSTHDGQSSAINTIKEQINANKPVMWGFYLPSNGWTDFFSFWSNKPDTAIWDPDPYNGGVINGGHEVLIIGYDDTVSTPYWLVLNSWGITNTRSTGLLRLKMKMNYDGMMSYNGHNFYVHDFDIYNTEFSGSIPNSETGNLDVKSNPSSATIIIDGNGTGKKTPAIITGLTQDTHTLLLRKSGYSDSTIQFNITKQKTTSLIINLNKPSQLSVSSKPSGASIWIDGNNTGLTTPASFTTLQPGIHSLKLIKSGYLEYSKTFTLKSGKTTSVSAVLTSNSAKIMIKSTPSGAFITFDGNNSGLLTPHTLNGITPGLHTLILRREGYKDWSKSVTIIKGKTSQVSAILSSSTGSLNIISTPSGADIRIDSVNTTYKTPKLLTMITPGPHEIVLSKTGYSALVRNTTVVAGKTTQLRATLKK